MNTGHYRQRLLELEKDLSARTTSERALGREQTADSPRDSAEASADDEAASQDFTEAELSSTLLKQVRDALKRIEDGTFGRCIVDGEAIEAKRLEASPWVEYCLKHQAALDAQSGRTLPTM